MTNVDNILFSPIRDDLPPLHPMALSDKEKIWDLFLMALPPEIQLNKIPEDVFDESRESLFEKLDEVGPISIDNVNEMRKFLNEYL